MNETSETVLGCTRNRRAWALAALPCLTFLAVDTAVMMTGALLVPRDPFARLLAGGAVAAIFLLGLALLSAPLCSKHRLLPGGLSLRFGRGPKAFSLFLAREEIESAIPIDERLSSMHPLRAYVDQSNRRLVAAFSPLGEVLLRLREPREMRFGLGRTAICQEVLINLDEPERLLASFAADSRPIPNRPNSVIATATSHTPSRPKAPGPKTSAVVEVESLTRRYGNRTAVSGLDLRLGAGEIYGLLGCNGAGKTTTLRMLVGLLAPTAGAARVAGLDIWQHPVEARRATGFAGDTPLLHERLTAREFLQFIAHLYGMNRAAAKERSAALLRDVDLTEDADRLCGTYSLGMKRRLALAAALMHEPSFLVLDEPLNGLDPRSARRLKLQIRAVAERGAAVLLSTHDLATAEELCCRIGVLHRGKLVAEGNAEELRRSVQAPNLEAAFLALTEASERAS